MFPFHLKISVITMAEAVMAMKHSATSVQKSGKNGNGNKQPRYMQNIQVQKFRENECNFSIFFSKYKETKMETTVLHANYSCTRFL